MIMRNVIVAVGLLVLAISGIAHAGEYCVDKYGSEITKVNGELGTLVQRQAVIDDRVATIYKDVATKSSSMADAATKIPPDYATIRQLGEQITALNRERAQLETEGFNNIDRIAALKGVVPAELQGKLRGCLEASAPLNKLVNLSIQSLAIASTGGLALALPPKALYVDMSAVLNGYPTGGPNSVINEARDSALNALGIGGKNNDIGKIVRDPIKVISCLFGC